MKALGLVPAAALVCGLLRTADADTWYVATNGNDSASGTNWTTAKATIQAAADLTAPGDTVLVSNGVYATGGRVVHGAMTNRVAIPSGISVISVNGPEVTTIAGAWDPLTTNGDAAVRCVYMGSSAFLSGFTLTNGATRSSGDSGREQSGGGAWCEAFAVLSNCTVIGNSASYRGGGLNGNSWGVTLLNGMLSGNSAATGGGAYFCDLVKCTVTGNSADSGGGAVSGNLSACILTGNSAISGSGGGSFVCNQYDCVLTGNTAAMDGGGSYYGILYNCLLNGNSASYGGGSSGGTLHGCTLAGNEAGSFGGGAQGVALSNCIVYSNAAPADPNFFNCTMDYCCATPMPAVGAGNITNDPQFVNAAAGNFHLRAASPCIDAGTTNDLGYPDDIDGIPRPLDGNADGIDAYDMGAFEYVGTHFVAITGTNPIPPYATWATAATNIQDAVDVSEGGNLVLVSNGIYDTGGRVVHGAMTNRVVITNAIAVRSVNGPTGSVIRGAGPMGDAAVRCVYVGAHALLSGFTLTNGYTRDIADAEEGGGGGAWCEPLGVLSNCVVSGNSARLYGGGAFQGILNNCEISGNSSWYGGGARFGTLNDCTLSANQSYMYGGGAYYSALNRCVLTGNSAVFGGGSGGGTLNDCLLSGNHAGQEGGAALWGTLNNCTLAGNEAAFYGGGARDAVLNNCIVHSNAAVESPNYINCTVNNSCTTPMPMDGTGNIAGDPRFVDAAASNFHLKAGSPCIDRGNNAHARGASDLDGEPRVAYGVVDMGAYEAPFPVGYWVWAGAITNGLTNLTDSATGDGYPNLLKYAAGSSPTSSDDVAAMRIGTATDVLAMEFNRNTNAADATLVVEGAFAINDGALWEGIATNFNGSWGAAPNVTEAGVGSTAVVTVQDRFAFATNRFLRLRVTRP
jgi:hypothetical protein